MSDLRPSSVDPTAVVLERPVVSGSTVTSTDDSAGAWTARIARCSGTEFTPTLDGSRDDSGRAGALRLIGAIPPVVVSVAVPTYRVKYL